VAKRSAVERFREAAAGTGVEITVSHFPEGTKTADDAARAIGCDVAQIVKSLVFVVEADATAILVLTSGANRVDVDKLAAHVGAAVRRANADEVRAATGFAIGGTPPFGHPQPVRTLVDPLLTTFAVVWAAGGTPDTVFPLSSDDLVRVTGGEIVDVTETDVAFGSSSGGRDEADR
jgi:prolyl-tRNA editing enzyme YbaK/EbsC (Cys-tRNA(Pro) deacylase)